MSKLEVADIFRRHGEAWRAANAGHVSHGQLRVMSAIEACRTATLGGHVERCEDCAHTRIKELIEQKERVDAELENLLGGAPLKAGRVRMCSVCNSEGHTARSCPTKSAEAA